jgi:hypothetical protein
MRNLTRRNFLANTLKVGAALLAPTIAGSTSRIARATETEDAITHRAREGVARWLAWLETNNVHGYLGEIGWPNSRDGARLYEDGTSDIPQWSALGEKVYSWLDTADVWATYWSASPTHGASDGIPASIWTAYAAETYDVPYSQRVFGIPLEQAEVIENFGGYETSYDFCRRGINTAGPDLRLGMTDFSNENPGEHGKNYLYPSATNLSYLRGRGHELIRLPFRWERVQPAPGGPLDSVELGRLRQAVTAIGAAGQIAILDVHNLEGYAFADGFAPLGSERLSIKHFADLWRRLSSEFGDSDTVQGYDLLNEPMNMPGGASTWEKASQAAVNAIRRSGDKTPVMVAGYHTNPQVIGGGVFAFVFNHPKAWIKDPLKERLRYTTHSYFGHYGYEWSYQQSNDFWKQRGY